MNFFGKVGLLMGRGPRTNRLDFGGDADHDPRIQSFWIHSHTHSTFSVWHTALGNVWIIKLKLVDICAGAKLSAVDLWSTRGSTCATMTSLPVFQWREVERRSVRVVWDERDLSPPDGATSSSYALSMMGRTSTAALSYLSFRFRSPVTPPCWPSAVSDLTS